MVLKKRKRFGVYGGRAGEERIGKHAVSLSCMRGTFWKDRLSEGCGYEILIYNFGALCFL